MDHQYIEEQNITERYLMRRLSVEEQARFEDHFIDCPECLERLETTEDLRGSLKSLAVEEAVRARTPEPRPLLSWLTQLTGWQQAALAVAFSLFLLTLPGFFFLKQLQRTRTELAGAKLTSAELERRYAEQQQALQSEQQARANLADELNTLSRLQTSAPVFLLSIVRSASPDSSGPVNRIIIPRSPQWIVFSLEREEEPAIMSYRVALTNSDGHLIWKETDLKLASRDALAISLRSSLFTSGDYVFNLEGLNSKGQPVSLTKYPFRVIQQPK
jgi:hypothetical protein